MCANKTPAPRPCGMMFINPMHAGPWPVPVTLVQTRANAIKRDAGGLQTQLKCRSTRCVARAPASNRTFGDRTRGGVVRGPGSDGVGWGRTGPAATTPSAPRGHGEVRQAAAGRPPSGSTGRWRRSSVGVVGTIIGERSSVGVGPTRLDGSGLHRVAAPWCSGPEYLRNGVGLHVAGRTSGGSTCHAFWRVPPGLSTSAWVAAGSARRTTAPSGTSR
jgi:hypothetical protein